VHGAASFAVSKLDDRDWVAQVRRELSPVRVGRFIVHGGHDAHRVGPNALGLRIEAAMAFGTGHHATTRGCLRLFDRRLRLGHRPARVADIGCGTGVLAMAAAKACRVPVQAGDVEGLAAETARANSAANGLSPWIRVSQGPGFRAEPLRRGAPYDLVFANILAAPLKRLAPDIARHLAPGGVAVLSGLLSRQAPAVASVYEGHGFGIIDKISEGGWTSLAVCRVRGRRPIRPMGRPKPERPGPGEA